MFDLKAYALGECDAAARRSVEGHVESCGACRTELDQLGVMHAALRALPDEEMPRRIAFVSDKVFEPKWYQRLFDWPKVALASTAMLSAAILVHGFTRPAPVMPVAQTPVAPVAQPVNVQAVVDAAVKQALAEADARHKAESARVLASFEKRLDERDLQMQASVNASFDVLSRQFNNLRKAVSINTASLETGVAR
ncbi:MAG: zf-HC2 domain-containing protein [Bryobacteraceae bacterium]